MLNEAKKSSFSENALPQFSLNPVFLAQGFDPWHVSPAIPAVDGGYLLPRIGRFPDPLSNEEPSYLREGHSASLLFCRATSSSVIDFPCFRLIPLQTWGEGSDCDAPPHHQESLLIHFKSEKTCVF